MDRRSLDDRPRSACARGFTFIEILIVMAIGAVLLGLGVGFLMSVGVSSLSAQAAGLLGEAGQRCLNESAGGGRALLEIRTVKDPQGEDRIEVRTAVHRTVFSANFEPAPTDQPDREWFVFANGPDTAKPAGAAKVVPEGHVGGGVSLTGGAYVEVGERSAFAMTDGVDVDAMVKPSPAGRGAMTIVRSDSGSQVLWQVQLVRGGAQSDGWGVVLRIALVPADSRGVASTGMTEFKTKDAPVLPSAWSRVQVSYDGREPSIKVNGVERWERPAATKGRAEGIPMRLVETPGGAARLLVSAPDAPFVGVIDTVNVAGIFRSDEDARWLPATVSLFRTKLPVAISFMNGRLDPTVHTRDVVVRLQGPGDAEDGAFTEVRYGLYGNIPPPRKVLSPQGGVP